MYNIYRCNYPINCYYEYDFVSEFTCSVNEKYKNLLISLLQKEYPNLFIEYVNEVDEDEEND